MLSNQQESTRITKKVFIFAPEIKKASIEVGTIKYPSGESRLFRKEAEATLQG